RELWVSNNQLVGLPTSIQRLTKLKWLQLDGNNLTELPAEIGDLRELRELWVSHNQLAGLPTSVQRLTKLERLYLDGNNLTELPAEIGDLRELRELWVSHNQLAGLPTSVQRLTKLERLYLGGNNLTELPAEIGDLRELRELWVSHNQLAGLPTSVQRLTKLQSLHLSNNKLTELPAEIGDLRELRQLSVSNNQLVGLPTSIQRLTNLKWLHLDGNNLTELPAEIGDLRELWWLTHPFFSLAPLEIEARGEKAQLAYQSALKDGAVNIYRGRVLLIGQDRAGKTSLKKSLIGLPFNSKEKSTDGIEVDPSKFRLDFDEVRNWQPIDARKQGLLGCSKDVAQVVVEKIHDISVNRDLVQEEERGDVILQNDDNKSRKQVGTDAENEEVSLVNQEGDPNEDGVNELTLTGPDHELVVDTTLRPDEIPPGEIKKRAVKLIKELKGEDVKAEESVVSIELWDFAGQHLYYASHPVFLSSRALYILVCNLSKSLHEPAKPCVRQGSRNVDLENPNGETNLENLLSWLSTVHSVAQMRRETCDDVEEEVPHLRPPVIIVGTHADKPFENIEAMKTEIQNAIAGKDYEGHVVRSIFSIDNTAKLLQNKIRNVFREDENIDDIRALRVKIMEVLRQEPYIGERIPVRWLIFEKVINALLSKPVYYLSITKLRTHAKEKCFINDHEGFTTMVNFYHDLGIIIKHRSTVILSTQWLIDLFGQLITIPDFEKIVPKFAKHWKEVEESGVLSMELLDHVFSKFLLKGVARKDILDLMEQFGLIAKFSSSKTVDKYFVPSQLKASPDSLCSMAPSRLDPCPLFVYFVSGSVPHGLFTRLVSRSVRWCSEDGPTQPPTLYQNGAWFVIGKKTVHDFVLICKKQFIKFFIKQRNQLQQISVDGTSEVAVQVREFVEATLQTLSRDLYKGGLQYHIRVACPYCQREKCSRHDQMACSHDDCLHLLELRQGDPMICKKKPVEEVLTVTGQEKWFSQIESKVGSSKMPSLACTPSSSPDTAQARPERLVLKVTLLANEWGSSKGGLSTINRTLAIHLAKDANVEVTILVPEFECGEEDKRAAKIHNISIREAGRLPAFSDPLDWLSFPPDDLDIQVVIGHGAKLGRQAQIIRKSHQCKWLQVVHTEPEELAMHKNYPSAIAKGEAKNRAEVELCQIADLVVAVGPKLKEAITCKLRSSHRDVFQFIPGSFAEFSDIGHAAQDGVNFRVLTFGRGDLEDFSLKGYDIAAKSIVELKDSSYSLVFVGATDGKQDEVAKILLQTGISKNQLIVRSFVKDKQRLRELFCEVDLAIMPSRTEGFGLTAVEAMSAGLPILVSGNSGFGKALRGFPMGESFVIDSDDPKEWAKAIAAIRQKTRTQRLEESQSLRRSYDERFSWERQCQALVDRMWKMVPNHLNSLLILNFIGVEKTQEDDVPQNGFEKDAATGPMAGELIFRTLQQILLEARTESSKTELSQALKRTALEKGFAISDNQGEGNCMFFALSEQLDLIKGIQMSHDELRRTVVQHLRENPRLPDGTELFHFVDGYPSWDAYLTSMMADGIWGDHVILHGAANCFETCIHVISSLLHRHDVMICPEFDVTGSNRLVLGHVYELHYVSLIPQKGGKDD
ncbi:unnamed protein product, partial [Porites lobata]